MNKIFDFINEQIEEDLEDLINGHTIKVSQIELNTLTRYMNDIGINTLMIQFCQGEFACNVDSQTILHHRNMRMIEEMEDKINVKM